MPRGVWSEEDFQKDTWKLWPDAEPAEAPVPGASAMRAAGGVIFRLPLPWLEVSSSLIRERWLEGRCLDYLVPQGVARLLETRRGEAARHWGKKQPS